MSNYQEFKPMYTFDEYSTIIHHEPKPTIRDRATQLISIWSDLQKKHTKIRVQTLNLKSAKPNEEKSLKEEEVRVDAVSHRQLLFTRRMQDMAQRLDTLPSDPKFILNESTCTPLPTHTTDYPQHHFGTGDARDAVFEGQTQFDIVADYVRTKRFCSTQEKTIRIRCESTIDPRWIGDNKKVSPLSQRTLENILREASTSNPRKQVIVVYCPTGWSKNITLPSNVALVELTPKGKWSWKHAIHNRDIVSYLDAIFNTDCHEERINRSIDTTLFQD